MYIFLSLQVLLRYGARVNQLQPNAYPDDYYNRYTGEGATALTNTLNSRDQSPKCVQLLVQAGATVNGIVNHKGETNLHLAAKAGSVQNVKILLNGGSWINVKHEGGLNALTEYFMKTNYGSDWGWIIEEKIATLLFAAGESLDLKRFGAGKKFDIRRFGLESGTRFRPSVSFVKQLLTNENTLSLKSRCRDVIRGCLLMVNPHRNLFMALSETGLPVSLQRYLVYGKSLCTSADIKDNSDNNTDDNDDDSDDDNKGGNKIDDDDDDDDDDILTYKGKDGLGECEDCVNAICDGECWDEVIRLNLPGISEEARRQQLRERSSHRAFAYYISDSESDYNNSYYDIYDNYFM